VTAHVSGLIADNNSYAHAAATLPCGFI